MEGKMQNSKKNIKKSEKLKKKNKIAKEKEQYFAFYDDIKKGSGKVIDW